MASDEAVTWLKVNLPTEGKPGNWVLAKGANIQCLTQSADGTLYCYANPTGTTYTLFKSTDSGLSWSYTGNVKDTIIDIVTPQDNANVVYYATAASVYKSNDAAKTFMPLPSSPGGAGAGNVSITSVDVLRTGSYYTVAVATRDADTGEFGGVYFYDETKSASGWQNTGIGNRDVYKVAFAPRLIVEQPHLIAVTSNEASTLVTTKIGLSGAWGSLLSDATIPVSSLVSADVAFPDNYGTSQNDFTLFLALNSGTNAGGAYIVYNGVAPASSSFVDLNIGRYYGISGIDVASIAIMGNSHTGKLLAGLAGSAQVYSGSDGGAGWWTRSAKPPTGSFSTCVMFAADFTQSGRAYAATSGTESAFSVTADAGLTWNQLSLINTKISTIVDVIPSPNYSADNTIFVLTFGGKHSLWRSTDGGGSWERVFSSALPDVSSLDLVRISPQFGESAGVIFVIGTCNGNPVMWKSADKGQNFATPRISFDPDSGATFVITQCAVIDDDSLMVGCYDGTRSLIYRTGNSGLNYSPKAIVSTGVLNGIAISPDYAEDKTILVGNRAGWVYYSEDGGVSFEPLPGDATVAPLSGNVSVTCDPAYSENKTVYAASDTAGKGIWRFVIGESTGWENIDGTFPTGGIVSSIGVSADGVLYAANSKAGGGMERCINPHLSGPMFETVTRGLETTARLNSMKIADNRLWAIDSANTRLLTFVDALSTPVTLKEPADEAGSVETKNTNLRWNALDGATKYEWQADTDDGFGNIPSGFSGMTTSTAARLPTLDTATTYYWRVRATLPVLSPWSASCKFTTILGGEADTPKLASPDVGAIVPLKPVMQWNGIAGAENYELLIATDYSFDALAVEKTGTDALPTTAWQCDISLQPDTTYYWKIRAIDGTNYSPWSNIGVFITEPEAVVKSPSLTETTPAVVVTPPAESPSTTLLPSPLPTVTTTLPQTTLTQIEQSSPGWVKWLFYLGGAILVSNAGAADYDDK